MKIAIIGSAVVDIIASEIPYPQDWKEKQRISSIQMRLGGDALNQSVRLADLGAESRLAAAVGNDMNGSFIISSAEARGVNTDFIAKRTDRKTGTALVLVDQKGDRNIFSIESAHSTIAYDDCKDAVKNADAVSIASLFSVPFLEKDGLCTLLENAQQEGAITFADLASDKLGLGIGGIKQFLPFLDYFLPSLSDCQQMSGLREPEDIADYFKKQGANNVIIKCGADGVYVLSDRYAGWIKAPKVTPVDVTGAGDSFAAFFIFKILQGASVDEACGFACHGASLSTLYQGACEKIITEAMIESFEK